MCAPEDVVDGTVDVNSGGAGGISGVSGDISGMLSGTVNEAKTVGSEVAKSLEELLKATGRVSLVAMRGVTGLWGIIGQTTSVAGKTLAKGTNTVKSYTDQVPVLGAVVSGTNAVVSGTSETFSKNVDYSRDNYRQLGDDLHSNLNNFNPGAWMTKNSNSESEPAKS